MLRVDYAMRVDFLPRLCYAYFAYAHAPFAAMLAAMRYAALLLLPDAYFALRAMPLLMLRYACLCLLFFAADVLLCCITLF